MWRKLLCFIGVHEHHPYGIYAFRGVRQEVKKCSHCGLIDEDTSR